MIISFYTQIDYALILIHWIKLCWPVLSSFNKNIATNNESYIFLKEKKIENLSYKLFYI